MIKIIQGILGNLEKRLALPGETENIRIRKSTLAIIGLLGVPINFSWSIAFIRLGLEFPAWINFAWGITIIIAVTYYFYSKNASTFLNILLGTLLIYSVALQFTLGGFVQSGYILINGVLVPMLAGVIMGRKATVFWAVIYVAVFGGAFIFDPFVKKAIPQLPHYYGVISGFFTIVVIVTLGTTMILHLVGKLEEAQERADRLLLNILPRSVVERLKREPGTIAEAYVSASVLFADIVGFTPLTEKLDPAEMIELLNEIYSHFDHLVERYGVEKIRTIGDNYMVVSGVPNPRRDHAQTIAHLALDMLEYGDRLDAVKGNKLNFRIGINSGSLTAGVIGTKKFQYDVWGDTVNTASRMESHGVAGKIQVTEETYKLIKDKYMLEKRGAIEVKGKGEMETWFLVGKKI